MANAESSAVDAATIDALKEDGSLLRELRDLFASEAPEQLGKMTDACRQSDTKALAHAAHRLKGTAVTFGAAEMQRRCIEIEELVKSGAANGIDRMIQELSAECDRVKLALDDAVGPS